MISTKMSMISQESRLRVMKLWSAIAVQLLAIALREHQRFDKSDVVTDCQPVEVICNCTESVPNQFSEPSVIFCAGLGSGLILGIFICVAGWLVGQWRSYGEVAAVPSRRRGGGVLS